MKRHLGWAAEKCRLALRFVLALGNEVTDIVAR